MKIPTKKISELAVFGGKPSFDEPLHVGRPNLGDKASFYSRVDHLFDNKWLTNNGEYVREFEEKVASYLGVKYCVATCNGTIAMQIAARALDLKGEVIMPSFTFLATPHAFEWQEIYPVFCDIDPKTHNCDPAKVAQLITPKTTAIVGVHLWGRACDTEALDDLSKRHHLKVIYDAAHAFGTSYQGKMIGSFGDAEILSFHATKFFNTFEGGAIVTNNKELAVKARYMKNFGFGGHDKGVYVGLNGKMTEICAAMGLTNFESLNLFIQKNKDHYEQYKRELSGIPGVSLVEYDEQQRNNYQYVVADFDQLITGISRDKIAQILLAENVMVKRYFSPPCHEMEPYRSYLQSSGLFLPETQKLAGRLLCLPTGMNIDSQQIQQICRMIRLILENAQKISTMLPEAGDGLS